MRFDMRSAGGWMLAMMLAMIQSFATDWAPRYAPSDFEALKKAFDAAWATLENRTEPATGSGAAGPDLDAVARTLALRRITLARDYRARLAGLRHYALTADDDEEARMASAEIARLDRWLQQAEADHGDRTRLMAKTSSTLPGGLENQLLLHYEFEHDAGPRISDASPRGHDGVSHGGRRVSQGRQGGGYWLDGLDDYIEVPAATSFWHDGAITVSLCVFRHATEEMDERLLARGGRNSRDVWMGITMDHRAAGGIRHLEGAGTFASEDQVVSSRPIPVSRWVHLTLTYDGEVLRLYVDGRLDRTRAAPGGISDSGADLCIGRSGPTRWRHGFMGVIDDVILWDRALSQVEVLGLHAALFIPSVEGR